MILEPHVLGNTSSIHKTFGDTMPIVSKLVLEDRHSGFKDKGKILGHGDEFYFDIYMQEHCPWVKPIWRKDIPQFLHEHPKFSDILNDSRVSLDKNGAGFDVLCVRTDINSPTYKLLQLKLRLSKAWHFENTRRVSEKNEGSQSEKGHVAYKIEESDAVVIMAPSKRIEDDDDLNAYELADLKFTAFLMTDLEDPNNHGFCITNISKKVTKSKGKSVEHVMANLFQYKTI